METQPGQQPSTYGLVLGIAGVGLIGGSIAAAARHRGVASRIIGIGRSPERLERARQAGLIDDFSTDYEHCRKIDLFVSCLPVDRIAESVREASRFMPAGSIATDAGSTKQALCAEICQSLRDEVTFVGSHPLAGSERNGFEHADRDLFEDRVCVITPTGAEEPEGVTRLVEFWESLGSRVVSLPADEHDRILARTSHVPHLAAAALASGLDEGDFPFASGGFRDATRIAAGDPALWTSILLANRDAVVTELEALITRCERFREALRGGKENRVRSLLADAKAARDGFEDPGS